MGKRSPNEIILLVGIDLILTEVSLVLAQWARLYVPIGQPLPVRYVALPPLVYGIVAVIWLVVLGQLSLYTPWRRPLRKELFVLTAAVVLAELTLAGVLYLSFRSVSRLLFLYFCAACIVLLGLVRIGSAFLNRRLRNRTQGRVLIVGVGRAAQDLASYIQRAHHSNVRVVGFLADEPVPQTMSLQSFPVHGSIDKIRHWVSELQVTEVIFALPADAHARLVDRVIELQKLPVQISVLPDVFDIAFPRTRVENVYGFPLVRLRDSAIDVEARIVKRLFDLAVSSIALVLLWPAMLLIAIAIKLDSKGPVIIRQSRIGENARLFKMLKFRSMVGDAELHLQEVIRYTPDDNIIHKRRDDPRVTRVGRFLRRFSLDELPQLWNVLNGEMSLVGPRPELPWLVEKYELWQWRRFAVPPGMTGWWQIHGRSDRPMHLHVSDDLYYIQNYSLWLDWLILLKTVFVVLKGQGAY